MYQIVFGTKNRQPSLSKDEREYLFRYISGIVKNNNCHLYQMNGVEDHMHILTSLHPSVALADLVKDIKLAGSKFIKDQKLFRHFDGWQDGYGAFTYSYDSKDSLIKYILNQEDHHKTKTFREEFMALLREHDINFDERYLL